MSSSTNPRIGEDHIQLRKRLDVIGRKQLIRRTSIINKPCQNDPEKPEISRTKKLTLSKLNDDYSKSGKEKLLLQKKTKCDQVDTTKSNEYPFKIQSQRLCLKRNHEMLGSILNPICLSKELRFRKEWQDPGYERPTWEMFKWDTPRVNLDDNIKSLTNESCKYVLEYVKSLREIYDILMLCKCSKTIDRENLEENFHEDSSNDVIWVKEENFQPLTVEGELTLGNNEAGYLQINSEIKEQRNQSTTNSLVTNSGEPLMIIDDVDSQSPKPSISHTQPVPLEISDLSRNDSISLNTTRNLLNNQYDMDKMRAQLNLLYSTSLGTSTAPVNRLESHADRCYADLFVEKSSEWNEYYSSNLMFLKGDETMVASDKCSEGKVVLHCIRGDFGDNQVSWDKDETITLYSDNSAVVANEIEVVTGQKPRGASPQSSRSSSSSHSSYSCSPTSDSPLLRSSSSSLSIVENDRSLPSGKVFMNSCFLHSMSRTDIELLRILEDTRKSSNELIVSSMVLHSILTGQSQKDLVDEMMEESSQ